MYLSGSWINGFFSAIADWAKGIYMSFYNAIVPDQRYLSYLQGLKITLLISFFAIILGILIGVLVAVFKVTATNYKMKWLSSICNVYINVIREHRLWFSFLLYII